MARAAVEFLRDRFARALPELFPDRQPFNSQLIVDAENDHAAAGICERDYLLRDLFSV